LNQQKGYIPSAGRRWDDYYDEQVCSGKTSEQILTHFTGARVLKIWYSRSL
jgi:hypothetical protein